MSTTQTPQQVNYEIGIKELMDINEVMQKAHKGLASTSTSLITFGAYNQVLSAELPKIYDKTSVYKNTIMQFSDSFARLNIILKAAGEKLRLFENSFQEWSKQFDVAKKVKGNYDTNKKRYDHYFQKIEKLRKKHDDCQAKNKVESTKDIQRLQRLQHIAKFQKQNEIKFSNSQRLYKTCQEESSKKIHDIYFHRFDYLHNFVIGYTSAIKEMCAKLDDKLSEIHNPKTSFDKCKQEILKQKQDDRIKKAIDQDLHLIEKVERENSKKYEPPVPDVSVRRKSIKLEMKADSKNDVNQQYNPSNNDVYNANNYDNNLQNNNYNNDNNAVNNVEEPVLYGSEYISNTAQVNNTYNNNNQTTTTTYNNKTNNNISNQNSTITSNKNIINTNNNYNNNKINSNQNQHNNQNINMSNQNNQNNSNYNNQNINKNINNYNNNDNNNGSYNNNTPTVKKNARYYMDQLLNEENGIKPQESNNDHQNNYSSNQQNMRHSESNAFPNPQYFSQRPSVNSNQMSTTSSYYQNNYHQPNLGQKQRSGQDYNQNNNNDNHNNYGGNQQNGGGYRNSQSNLSNVNLQYSVSAGGQQNLNYNSNRMTNNQYNNNASNLFGQHSAQPSNQKAPNPFDNLLDD